jgi:hypothetical protein
MVCATFFFLLLLLPPGVLAASGGSLFEQVATRNGDSPIPYPLDALLGRIAAQLADGRDGLRIVLIPVGRSLQRHAAGDAHYFDSPRAVIAVTGEPIDPSVPLLKDRLYLGHHAAAGVLEVVSYDEGSGRFEFLIVDDYRAGGTPRLRAGNRGLCLACHQNDAPIFSRQSWDETSANPIIARLLASTGRDYDGLPWHHGVDVPQAIDEATERANLLPVAQRLWSACGDGDAGRACRSRLAWRTLVSRLRGAPDNAPMADDADLAPLVTHWRRDWPEGLRVPEPDLPNRQPFAATLPWQQVPTDAATLRELADVAERFDALALRPAREFWPLDAHDTPAKVFHALGQFISETDVGALDTALRARDGATVAEAMDCRIGERGTRRNLDCRIGTQLRMQARLEGKRLRIDRLVLDGQAVPPPAMQFTAAGFEPTGRRPRRPDGRALNAILIDGDAASIRWVDDLAPVREVFDSLGDAALAPPLRRANLLGPVLSALGQRAPAPVATDMPVADNDLGPHASDPALTPFYRHCALCHSSTDAFPPGFLRGDDATVLRRVGECAPRMLRRLSMWRHPAGTREKTPMPPPASAQAEALQQGDDLATMRAWLSARLKASGNDPARLDALAYADLPPCAVYPESAHGR